MFGLGVFHNVNILKTAEKTINSFLEDENTTLWIEINGECFIPKGPIKINFSRFYEIKDKN